MSKRAIGMAIFLAQVLGVVGCATPFGSVRQSELDVPLKKVQYAVVTSLPLGKRKVSPNGREFFSHYFKPGKRKRWTRASRSRYRYYAHAYILGDRRPYTVDIVVYKEERVRQGPGLPSTYRRVGTEEGLAKFILRKVNRRLTERVEERNIIDDFRVF